jgi:hypothetical protein
MLADQNPYAAPQAVLRQVARAWPAVENRRKFPWALVRQGLRNGAVAGVLASLAMLFVFVLRTDHETPNDFFRLLAICGWFMLATSACGLFWGFNHAIIVWILRHGSIASDDV